MNIWYSCILSFPLDRPSLAKESEDVPNFEWRFKKYIYLVHNEHAPRHHQALSPSKFNVGGQSKCTVCVYVCVVCVCYLLFLLKNNVMSMLFAGCGRGEQEGLRSQDGADSSGTVWSPGKRRGIFCFRAWEGGGGVYPCFLCHSCRTVGHASLRGGGVGIWRLWDPFFGSISRGIDRFCLFFFFCDCLCVTWWIYIYIYMVEKKKTWPSNQIDWIMHY